MGRLNLLIALIILPGAQMVAQDKCSELPLKWDSEKEAISQIENTAFIFKEYASPSGSSWMHGAHYYACDDHDGYLIVTGNMKGKKVKSYVHQNVPIEIWNSLKKANSMGGFYMVYIKNYYQLTKADSKEHAL